jgi:hypothetical protein
MFVICYLFCGWCFGGLFYRMLTYFNKVKNVGIKFVMVPKWYMVPKGNTFRIFRYGTTAELDGHQHHMEMWQVPIFPADESSMSYLYHMIYAVNAMIMVDISLASFCSVAHANFLLFLPLYLS